MFDKFMKKPANDKKEAPKGPNVLNAYAGCQKQAVAQKEESKSKGPDAAGSQKNQADGAGSATNTESTLVGTTKSSMQSTNPTP